MQVSQAVNALFVILAGSTLPVAADEIAPRPYRLESYPDAIAAALEVKEKQLSVAIQNVHAQPFYLIVPSLNRWEPGSIVKIAFNGGDDALLDQLAVEASEWTKPGRANLRLQFKDASGNYLRWTPADNSYVAEIRVAFQSGAQGGYWSHVGRNSIDRNLAGGNPGEASLNLDSFDKSLPPDWKAVSLHEFGHALGFQHEHQNPTGGCDFRFEDDPGYIPTKNAQGWFINDSNNRRPGLYTYLGGYANYWPKWKVDNNLRSIAVSSAYLVGTFDRISIMKYFFDASMFSAGENSPCYTKTENLVLSPQDAQGAAAAYPAAPSAIEAILSTQKKTLSEILSSSQVSGALRQSLQLNLDRLQ
ncbi:hypothetical protein [Rhizobium sp. 62_C5_N11_2]|uniref:hypothetical protein n=1 Tax=Rhizobium sp. 62_C5_N11_2 TaxID=3240772 RepID=UPI003F1FB519